MKYIKTYEGIAKYKTGDYVLLDLEEISTQDKTEKNDVIGDGDLALITGLNDDVYLYSIKFPSDEHEMGDYSVRENEIIRELTPSEIKEFNERERMYKNVNKYNL